MLFHLLHFLKVRKNGGRERVYAADFFFCSLHKSRSLSSRILFKCSFSRDESRQISLCTLACLQMQFARKISKLVFPDLKAPFFRHFFFLAQFSRLSDSQIFMEGDKKAAPEKEKIARLAEKNLAKRDL